MKLELKGGNRKAEGGMNTSYFLLLTSYFTEEVWGVGSFAADEIENGEIGNETKFVDKNLIIRSILKSCLRIFFAIQLPILS